MMVFLFPRCGSIGATASGTSTMLSA